MTEALRAVPPGQTTESDVPNVTPSRGSARASDAPVSSVALGPGTGFNFTNGIQSSYAPLGYMLPWEILDYIELLARYNPDFSQSVSNIKTLANSGHELVITAASGLQEKKVRALLETKARTIQEEFGGIDGLINKLLDQAATYGAMCGEWLLSEDLTDVVGFADVNPKSIRYYWDVDSQSYLPFQKVTASQAAEAEKKGQQVVNGCIALNPATFHYYAFDAYPGMPYGTPPFLAALGPIAIQQDMTANMAQIVKKIGLLGIVDMTVKALTPNPGETPEQLADRAGAFLDSYVDVLTDVVKDGGIVHFDDVATNTFSIAGNAAGATNIFKQNEEQVFSGLKSMPSVQGRSYSTTETYAGVAYDIMIRLTQQYQRGCKRMIEAGYFLIARAAGLNPDSISIEFNDNKTLHRLQDAQAHALELHNLLVLWAAGILNQSDVAQSEGYDEVATEYDEIPDSTILGNSGDVSGATVPTEGEQPDAGSSTGDGKPDNQNRTALAVHDDDEDDLG